MASKGLMMAMLNRYEQLAYTDQYILVFRYKGNVYMVITDSRALSALVSISKASRGAGYALRFRPTRAQKEMLMGMGATLMCSEKFFNELVASSKYNKGEIAEKLVTEYFGLVWTKDSVPFTEAGDIEVNGVAYQIKYEAATFTNEKILAKLS